MSAQSKTTPVTARLQHVLGHEFEETNLLDRALTHASAGGGRQSNERLEFLGDRVLGLVVADMLLQRFADEDEGAIAKRHTALVRREALARVARSIELGAALQLSKGEEDNGGRSNPAILADACEAVIAALYRDGGLEAARRFIAEYWTPLLEETETPPRDDKTALQEWAQGRGLPLPSYTEVDRQGPAHEPVFVIEAAVSGFPAVRADGASKRQAEQKAAAVLLEKVGKLDD